MQEQQEVSVSLFSKKEAKLGLLAGVLLLIMTVAAGYSYGFAQTKLLGGGTEITNQSVLQNQSLFVGLLIGWGVIFVTDLIVSFALFGYFKRTSKQVSMITAIARLVYTAVLGIAIAQLLPIFSIFDAAETTVIADKQFKSFEFIWNVGLIIFGLHLIGLGNLVIKSDTISKFWGYLLYIGGTGYVIVEIATVVEGISQTFADTAQLLFVVPMTASELGLAILLIYKGVKELMKSH